jgi:hypothetical protein
MQPSCNLVSERTLTKTGRNQDCPCGSGRKYKHCHGGLSAAPAAVPGQFPFPPSVLDAMHRGDAASQRFSARHGAGKEVISQAFNGMRFVAAGKSLHYSASWRNFHDFLTGYLAGKLGKEWGDRQVKLPVERQSPAAQWYTAFTSALRFTKPDADGCFLTTTGAANAWLRLAYDLYLINHNAELQNRLLRRLRDPVSFQGARFEAAVAAMMLASGYELSFANERGPGKHPEFHATHRDTGLVLAVEAKSRQRPGIMGFQVASTATPPATCSVERLLLAGAEKDTEKPLLVFVELNVPTYGEEIGPGPIWQELQSSCLAVASRTWPRGFPCVGAVFYNDVAPWFLREPLRDASSNIWVGALCPNTSRHTLDFNPHVRRIVEGCLQRSDTPMEFPGP